MACVVFRWRERDAATVWAPFAADTDYFGPGPQSAMVNYRVKVLDAMLAQLREAGAEIDEKREDNEYGRFAWVTDPEGNRIELWQPPADEAQTYLARGGVFLVAGEF
jgi:predicted enzyme related to lactoylglutathione lyase